MSQNQTHNQQTLKFTRFFYKAKYIFSSGQKFRQANGKYEATAHTLITYFTRDELSRKGVKNTIKQYAERNNIPEGFYCHIYGLNNPD